MVGGVIIPDDTKTYKARAVMYLVVLDPIMRSLCEGREPGDLLFEQPGREGMMIREWGSASRDDGWLSVGLRRAGIPGHLTIHDLRHTAASLMGQSGSEREGRATAVGAQERGHDVGRVRRPFQR